MTALFIGNDFRNNGLRCSLEPVRHIEFFHDVADVIVHRSLAYPKDNGYVPGGLSETQDFNTSLSLGEKEKDFMVQEPLLRKDEGVSMRPRRHGDARLLP
jgi:hypothetical protein